MADTIDVPVFGGAGDVQVDYPNESVLLSQDPLTGSAEKVLLKATPLANARSDIPLFMQRPTVFVCGCRVILIR